MTIAICGSLNFTYEIQSLAEDLRQRGFTVRIPLTSERILRGEVTLEQIKQEKNDGSIANRVIGYDAIRAYWEVIQSCDVILVANYEKNGVPNYIGGNSFLEMGFAHISNKKIFLLNDIPTMLYTDEIREMQPIVLNGDLSLIK